MCNEISEETMSWGFYAGVFECRVQNEVDEVVDIMQSNIGRVMERGERLEDLHEKSGEK